MTNDGTNLYVADRDNFRIAINNMSTGAFVGSIGLRINNQPANWSSTAVAAGSAVPTQTGFNSWYTNRDYVFAAPDQAVIQGNYMYVSDTSNNRIKRYSWLDGSYHGWIGLTSTQSPTAVTPRAWALSSADSLPAGVRGGGFTSSASFGFNTPRGLASDGTYLYVADAANHRIVRINISTGAFSGWIGYITTSPSDGDSGCNGAAAGTATPGWCLGGVSGATPGSGTAGAYTLGGFSTPTGLSGFTDTDGVYYLIVGDSGNTRLQKINATTPSIVSWIGINNSGSTLSSTCGSTATGVMLSSWCTLSGITSTSGNTTNTLNNGGLYGTRSIAIDTTTSPYYAYVTSSYGRVQRFNASTGAFAGYIGTFGSSITNSACISGTAQTNTITPSWCNGGNFTQGTGSGQFGGTVAGVYFDSTYIYASDTANFRIQKFNKSTGTYVGWTGRVQSASGIGGGAGCSSITAGGITPSWCTGGTSMGGYLLDLTNKKAAFDTPNGIVGMGSYMYVIDSANGRVVSLPTN